MTSTTNQITCAGSGDSLGMLGAKFLAGIQIVGYNSNLLQVFPTDLCCDRG